MSSGVEVPLRPQNNDIGLKRKRLLLFLSFQSQICLCYNSLAQYPGRHPRHGEKDPHQQEEDAQTLRLTEMEWL
jgi:hypothetical protein